MRTAISDPPLTTTHSKAISRVGHALADANRTRILLSLRSAPATPSQLCGELGLSKQSVSNHLACLRGCGLVAGTRDGRTVTYALAHPDLADLMDAVAGLTTHLDPTCCTGATCECR